MAAPPQPTPAPSNKRLQQTQAQIDEVVNIMGENVDKIIERDEGLSALDEKAEALHDGAAQFETNAGKLKREYWWKNGKMMIIIAMFIIVTIIIIIVSENVVGQRSSAD